LSEHPRRPAAQAVEQIAPQAPQRRSLLPSKPERLNGMDARTSARHDSVDVKLSIFLTLSFYELASYDLCKGF
jgi:hypothetical protein